MSERTPVDRSVSRDDYANLPRYPLRVCATLVQNPANLGRLCRTVEAFRLQSLILSDFSITQTPAFRNSAASAHHWQPLEECAVDALPDWLVQQKRSQYALIALDAAAHALPLPQFSFPQRSILLLGQELTGIPDAILSQCDHRITIPQFGMVESLNVQTAGSIAIYEYVRQRTFSEKSKNE